MIILLCIASKLSTGTSITKNILMDMITNMTMNTNTAICILTIRTITTRLGVTLIFRRAQMVLL